MRSSYRLTLQHGISPRELWQVLESDRRLFVPVGERSRFVICELGSGRWTGFLAQEAEDTDDVWEIVAARERSESEVSQARRVRGDQDA